MSLVVSPSRIRQFGAPEQASFCLVTNSSIVDVFRIIPSSEYADCIKIAYDHGDNFDEILANKIPQRCHVLVISPEEFFSSPAQDRIGSERKLIAMACNSTPTPLEAIAHFLKVLEDTDPEEQQSFADRFFDQGQKCQFLEFIDGQYDTCARFDHLDESYIWNEQAGLLGWGEQQLAPSGEISVLPISIQRFDEKLRLAFNGTVALRGYPILHNGTPSFLRSDQERLYQSLATIRDAALLLKIEDGLIVALEASSDECLPALKSLSAMFEVDSRYRNLWEIGFAINTRHQLYAGNSAMNEVYGGQNGTVHFGVGLTPYTQYHLDIICPGTTVLASDGDVLLGSAQAGGQARIKRLRGMGCPCSVD